MDHSKDSRPLGDSPRTINCKHETSNRNAKLRTNWIRHGAYEVVQKTIYEAHPEETILTPLVVAQ